MMDSQNYIEYELVDPVTNRKLLTESRDEAMAYYEMRCSMKTKQEYDQTQGLLQSQHRAVERANEVAKKMQADMLARMKQKDSNKVIEAVKK